MPLPALICLNSKLAVKVRESSVVIGLRPCSGSMPRQEHIARDTCSQG